MQAKHMVQWQCSALACAEVNLCPNNPKAVCNVTRLPATCCKYATVTFSLPPAILDTTSRISSIKSHISQQQAVCRADEMDGKQHERVREQMWSYVMRAAGPAHEDFCAITKCLVKDIHLVDF